ncbi:MAG: glycosyltransferase [candidate division KSB1 bacterium]|nr:glycosyltransferase [candidate division KSB1 bacterium]
MGFPSSASPKVSIIMPAYNAERYVSEAIESILGQTFGDFELIVIDDGSTDNTRQVISQYHDPRIVFCANEVNLGLTESLNRGLRRAKGEYIARQDADDVSKRDRLERQVQFLDANPDIALVGSSWFTIDPAGRGLSVRQVPQDPKSIAENLLVSLVITHATVMFRKESVLVVGGYRKEAGSAEDLDLWLRLAERFKIANLHEPLYSVRVHKDSVVSSGLQNHLESIYRVRQMALERWQQIGENLSPPTVIARCYFLMACQDFLMKRIDRGVVNLRRAVETESSIVTSHEANSADIAQYALWASKLAKGDNAPDRSSDAGRNFIEQVVAHLSPEWGLSLRRVYGRFLIVRAFDSYYQDRFADTIGCALLGMGYDRLWIRNRGLWRIMLASLLRRRILPNGFGGG